MRRHATSRTPTTLRWFGDAHNWMHQWQWELSAVSTDEQGRAVLRVNEPWGVSHRFTETAPGEWTADPGIKDRLVLEGDLCRVLRFDASEVQFERVKGGQSSEFRLVAMVDAIGNLTRMEWRGDLLHRIVEPAGRWLEIG